MSGKCWCQFDPETGLRTVICSGHVAAIGPALLGQPAPEPDAGEVDRVARATPCPIHGPFPQATSQSRKPWWKRLRAAIGEMRRSR